MTADESAARHLHFELRGDMQALMGKVRRVEAFLLETGCTAASAQQMAVVAEEIFANIVRDAWPGREPGHCSVDVTAVAGADAVDVSLRTEDDGIPFDPTAAEAPDLEASLEDRPIGGVGILLISGMTDAQSYQRRDGHNVFEVRKRCPTSA